MIQVLRSRMSTSIGFIGPVQKHIESKLSKGLDAIDFTVTNESHGRKEDESHFHVLVVSPVFEGVRRIDRHRMVQNMFVDQSGALKFHSLRITARTEAENDKSNGVVAKAPSCTGKGDGRAPTNLEKL